MRLMGWAVRRTVRAHLDQPRPHLQPVQKEGGALVVPGLLEERTDRRDPGVAQTGYVHQLRFSDFNGTHVAEHGDTSI